MDALFVCLKMKTCGIHNHKFSTGYNNLRISSLKSKMLITMVDGSYPASHEVTFYFSFTISCE